jgi:hypothetical protein
VKMDELDAAIERNMSYVSCSSSVGQTVWIWDIALGLYDLLIRTPQCQSSSQSISILQNLYMSATFLSY